MNNLWRRPRRGPAGMLEKGAVLGFLGRRCTQHGVPTVGELETGLPPLLPGVAELHFRLERCVVRLDGCALVLERTLERCSAVGHDTLSRHLVGLVAGDPFRPRLCSSLCSGPGGFDCRLLRQLRRAGAIVPQSPPPGQPQLAPANDSCVPTELE